VTVEECSHYGVSDVTMRIDSENAVNVRFNSVTARPASICGNGASNEDLQGAASDFRHALIQLGCSADLISDKWIVTHVRWINWKLASLERSFAPFLGGRAFTFSAVVRQLHRRFNKEIRDGVRPVLRQVLNKDVPESSMMILCVAKIRLLQSSKHSPPTASTNPIYKLEMTDGWYSISSAPDCALSEQITKGTIRVGTKLLVSNSRMTGHDNGVDPLDHSFDPDSPSGCPVLHLAANSTRLARWNAKLGRVPLSLNLVSQDGALLVKRIADVRDNGGRIPAIDLRILRKYPLMFLVRKSNVSDGTSTSRILSETEEIARLEAHEKHRLDLIERVSEEITTECEMVRPFPLVAITIADCSHVDAYFDRKLTKRLQRCGIA
jgi:breast cancer 2 susceptibility protein